MRLYHFTSEHNLAGIQADGEIRPSDPNLFSGGPSAWWDEKTGREIVTGGPFKGQAVVWFLDTPTVDGDHGLKPMPGDPVDKRERRITVEVQDGRPWLRWLTARRHDPAHVRAIIQTGGGMACARHWYVVARPIRRAEWVEVRDMRAERAE